MGAKRQFLAASVLIGLIVPMGSGGPLRGQEPAAPADTVPGQQNSDPLAALSPENRALFDQLRNAAQQGDDTAALATGRKLLPALTPGTRLYDFVTQITAGSAVETGDDAYALTVLKPFTDTHPDDWRAASLLARAYAETGNKELRDKQIAHVIALHKKTKDPDFAKLHIFPIQKVALHSGYVVFLYPFEPLKPYNTYLVALIYASDGKQEYRLELGSEDADQAFFKPRHAGERRFSIDSYRPNPKDESGPESQALHGFIDGAFEYDVMRDRMVAVANGEKSSSR